MYFNDWLTRRRLYTPQRIAVVDDDGNRACTYSELDLRAARLAAYLGRSCQIRQGDRVACVAANCLEFIDLYFACGKIGAILVPLNLRLPAAQISELLLDCQPKLLVHDATMDALAESTTRDGIVPQALRLDSRIWLTGDQPPIQTCTADEQDVAMILYTSGTTGQAKGAMLTWRQIHWNALNTLIGLQLTEQDAAFLNMPLYHTGGWHVLFTPLMLAGGRVHLQRRFVAERCNDQMGPQGISILFGVPTMLRMMQKAENFATADFSRIRFAICGGEPCPLPIIDAYQQRGVAIRQGYGLTEAGPNCFSLPVKDAIRKQGSIGFPNFFIHAGLVNDQDEQPRVGEVGELRMKGPHVFSGYWNNKAETSHTLRDGWLYTGDLMTRDEEGYYFVVGRKKEMFISGGENVYPAQVERVLQSHADIALVAVIGVPHPQWGEAGWAFVQLHEGHSLSEAELLNWSRPRLAAFQCPARAFISARLPLGHSGKVDKLTLRQEAAELAKPS